MNQPIRPRPREHRTPRLTDIDRSLAILSRVERDTQTAQQLDRLLELRHQITQQEDQ